MSNRTERLHSISTSPSPLGLTASHRCVAVGRGMCSLKKPTHTCSLSIHKSTDTHCRTCALHYLHIRPHPPLPFECLNCICPLSLTEDKLCFRAVFPLPVLMECQSVHLKMVDQYSYSPLPPFLIIQICVHTKISVMWFLTHMCCVISVIKQYTNC